MTGHGAEAVIEGVRRIAVPSGVIAIGPAQPLADASDEALAAALARFAAGTPGALVPVEDPALLAACLADPGFAAAGPRLLVPPALFETALALAPPGLWLRPGTAEAIPAEAGDYPAAIAVVGDLRSQQGQAVAAELCRVTAPGGAVGVITRDGRRQGAAPMPGQRNALAWLPDPAPAGGPGSGAGAFVCRLDWRPATGVAAAVPVAQHALLQPAG